MATVAATKQAPRIKGVCAAAREFGCTWQHLGLVAHGQRVSPKLLKKFRAWQAERRTQKAKPAP